MLEFDTVYDFYRLPETDRIKLIGKVFREKDRGGVFYPIGLHEDQFNYRSKQGLIYITPIARYKGKKWFKAGVVSPDDLDLDLAFEEPHTAIRQEVIAFVAKMPKKDRFYKEFLQTIQRHFKAGELG